MRPYLILLLFLFSLSGTALSQDCRVMVTALEQSYTGECKKGKANGIGVAVGVDRYEGNFKDGYPEGEGSYTWQNGNSYKGHFLKGEMHGEGEMTYKHENGDSVVKGFWKKNVFAGLYEHPYKIWFRTKKVSEIEIEHSAPAGNHVTVYIINTSTQISDNTSDDVPRMKINDIEMVKGTHGRVMLNNNHAKKSETVINDITIPSRMKLVIDTEEVEIEFLEAGTYTINIRINS
jgi:hypothetical protein